MKCKHVTVFMIPEETTLYSYEQPKG